MAIFGARPCVSPNHVPLMAVGARKLIWCCLDDSPLCVYTHWDESVRRTFPCTGEVCPCIEKPQKRIFRAYMLGGSPVSPNNSPRHFVVEITQSAYLTILNSLPEGEPWTGAVLEAWRTGTHRNARCEGQYLRRESLARRPAIDVQAILYRIWGYRPESNPQQGDSQ